MAGKKILIPIKTKGDGKYCSKSCPYLIDGEYDRYGDLVPEQEDYLHFGCYIFNPDRKAYYQKGYHKNIKREVGCIRAERIADRRV